MRITAGDHRGRRLAVPAGRDVRPTSDRARQALFNILEHGGLGEGGGSPVRGAHVLDAFAGSGALGLEALSRGAASATFMDTAAPALDAIRRNVEACREEENAEILRADATRPPRPRVPCTFAFLDPPYTRNSRPRRWRRWPRPAGWPRAQSAAWNWPRTRISRRRRGSGRWTSGGMARRV